MSELVSELKGRMNEVCIYLFIECVKRLQRGFTEFTGELIGE